MKINVYLWNFFFVGLTVMGMSFMSMRRMLAWSEAVNFFAGVWLIVSPLFLIYYDRSDIYFWNSVISGALISFFAALALPELNKIHYHKHKPHEEHFIENPHQRRARPT